jgi:two-component system, chemotaxis family, protein-glutamate methylesterase/glutaminase
MADGLVFAIGASAGGVEALRQITTDLPGDFEGTILIVQHTPENGAGNLADLLARRANIPVVIASERLVLKPGVAYVAPPGKHMVVKDGRIQTRIGPSVNRHRPAIDPMFQSVAESFGVRAVGIILTGYLDDGTAGLIAIREAGGRAIVQDPDDAAVPSMPLSALQYVTPEYCLPLTEIASTMVALTNEAPRQSETTIEGAPPDVTTAEGTTPERTGGDAGDGHAAPAGDVIALAPRDRMVTGAPDPQNAPHKGKPSVFVCPECLGTLWETENHNLLQFQCRVGHAFSAETIYSEQAENMEKAMWTAVRALQEHADMSLRLAERARKHGHSLAQLRFENRFKDATRDALRLQEVLTRSGLVDDQDSHTAD